MAAASTNCRIDRPTAFAKIGVEWFGAMETNAVRTAADAADLRRLANLQAHNQFFSAALVGLI